MNAELALPIEESNFTGLELFFVCQHSARHLGAAPAPPLPPGGAQMFYHIRYALLRCGMTPEVEPDARPLPIAAAKAFLQTMPPIALRLAADFGRALALLEPATPLLRWRVAGELLKDAPELHRVLERRTGVAWQREPAWLVLWERFWQATEREYAARMLPWLHPQRLLVVPIAYPDASDEQALALLRARLAQDQAERGWGVPPPDVYLYEQSLIEWLLRPLLAGGWIAALCRMLTATAG